MLVGGLLGGCQSSAPQGSTGGRIDPYATTEADRRSRAASMPTLLEFGDQAAQNLIRDLPDVQEIQALPTKAVLELGDIANNTRTPSNNFEMIQRRLRGQLLQSRMIKDNFIVVESGRRMDLELTRVTGPPADDLLQEGGGGGGTAQYDPNITFLLMGDFYEAGRGDTRRYWCEFKLVNLGSRQIVENFNYEWGQRTLQ